MSTKLVKNSQKKQQESTAAEVLQNLLEYLTVLFGIIMAGVLVFYMQEGYVKIGTAKFNVYAHVCVFGMPLLLLLAIFWLLTEKQEKQKKFRQRFSTTDLFLLAFLLLALISFVASGDLKACFWGYDGWYMGLFAQLTFVLLYFVFSRFCKDGKLVLTALCLFAAYAFVIGILQPFFSLFGDDADLLDQIRYETFTENLSEASRDVSRMEFLQNDYYRKEYEDAAALDVLSTADGYLDPFGLAGKRASVELTENYEVKKIVLTVGEKEEDDTEGMFVEQGKVQGSKVVLDGLKQRLMQYYGAEEEQIQISYGGER